MSPCQLHLDHIMVITASEPDPESDPSRRIPAGADYCREFAKPLRFHFTIKNICMEDDDIAEQHYTSTYQTWTKLCLELTCLNMFSYSHLYLYMIKSKFYQTNENFLTISAKISFNARNFKA